ncbi:MAG: glycosyltransferase family 2 protein [Patescibacteria group bacterium]|jgi:dolichol-phosphate mannosyltransferase
MKDLKKLSIVMPCYNEEDNVEPLHARIAAVSASLSCQLEIIFVENGSRDKTRERLIKIASTDPRVRVLVLSRNFGYQGAISAGLSHATGDAVVVMDGDQQDPPEMIPSFIEKWKEGFFVVYGTRAKREATFVNKLGYKWFYRIMRWAAYIEIPLDASDFVLMDRQVVDIIVNMPERDRLVRGLRAYAGFPQTGVPYERPARAHGVSSFRFMDYVRFGLWSIFSFSYKPLEFISYLAIGAVGLTILGMIVFFILALSDADLPRGFSSIILIMLFLGGIQLFSMAIIGQYIGRIFAEIKQRPMFIKQAEIHFETPSPSVDSKA